MAVTDAYATAAEYRASITKTDTGEDAEVLEDLTAISRYIEHLTQRFFTVDASDVTRVYVVGAGLGAEPARAITRLYVDDLSADPTTIKIDVDDDGLFSDETALASTDYQLGPLNYDVGPEPKPYEYIDLTRWGDQNSWPYLHQVEVIAKWGHLSVPQAIQRACVQLTGILRLESPRATGRLDDDLQGGTQESRESAMMIERLLKGYRRVRYE